MLRVKPNTSYIKRTFRPLYGWTQMTPKSVFLDAAWDRSVNIWPGMIFARTSGENVTLITTGMVPYGFGALYVGGDGIDEPLDVGLNAFAVWVMGPDAEAEILAPAFDTTATFTDAGDGTEQLLTPVLTGANRGKLTPVGATASNAACRLLKVNSATKITVGGFR